MQVTRADRVPTAFAASLLIVALSASGTQGVNRRPTASSTGRKATAGKRPPKASPASVNAGAKGRSARMSGAKKRSDCNRCAGGNKRRKAGKRAQKASCHPPGYLDPAVARRFSGAVAEMRRSGITPRVTSAWRSSAHQATLRRCSLNSRCRHANGVYGALPPGQSLHEAGFAVDIAGIANGRRGATRLTRRGRTIVRIMRKHGFQWRYGLADPVHFEADPRRHGYRNVRQAIVRNQTRCRPIISSSKAKRQRTKTAGASRVTPRSRRAT